MDFLLNERHILLRKLFNDFGINEVKPLAKEIDEEERFPSETVEKMKDLKMFGISVSKEFGGSGADYLSYILAVMELSKFCATTGVVLSAHTSLCIDPITQFGTKEQKQKYLPRLATGEHLGAFALTEPEAGTDAGSQKTTAIDKGDYYEMQDMLMYISYLL